MPQYLSPGVYVEEVEAGSRPIEGVGTAVAAFVGLAARGPFNEPTLVTNWSQFVQNFGDFVDGSYLAHAVYGYFLNGGGAKSIIAQRIDSFLATRQWKEKKFATKIRVDAEEWDSPTHKVDCFKGRVGLEIEWNNKDPFYDRDLNNFRLLFDLRVIEVGVIVTRASNLQAIFRSLGPKVGNKSGASIWKSCCQE